MHDGPEDGRPPRVSIAGQVTGEQWMPWSHPRGVLIAVLSVTMAINGIVLAGCARKAAPSESHDAGVVLCPPDEAVLRAAADYGARLPPPPLPDGGEAPDPTGHVVILFGPPDGGFCQPCRSDAPLSLGVTAPVVRGAWSLHRDGGLSRADSPLTAVHDYAAMRFEERLRLMLVQACGTATGTQVVTSAPMLVIEFTMQPDDGGWTVGSVRIMRG